MEQGKWEMDPAPLPVDYGAVLEESGKWPNAQWKGTRECLVRAAAVMFSLGNYLMACDKRVRVTIECDPETELFWVKREVFN